MWEIIYFLCLLFEHLKCVFKIYTLILLPGLKWLVLARHDGYLFYLLRHPFIRKKYKKNFTRSEYSHSVGCELDTHLAKRFSRKYAHKLKRKVMFINSIHFQKHKCIQTRKTKEWLYFLSIAYPEELSCGMRWGWPSLEDCMEFMIFDFSILSLKYYFESFIFNN